MTEALVAWAARVARGHLEPLDQRWHHTLGAVDRARELAAILRPGEHEVLVAASYLHDIGYAPELARTGFHPLDGARYLRALGYERLACLVAHHSGAEAEAEERRLVGELTEFEEERSLVARALTYCDLVTGPDGSRVGLEARLADLGRRYNETTAVGRAVRCSAASFRSIVTEVEESRGSGSLLAGGS